MDSKNDLADTYQAIATERDNTFLTGPRVSGKQRVSHIDALFDRQVRILIGCSGFH